MIKEAIIKLSKKEDLSYEMAQAVMDEIMARQMIFKKVPILQHLP